MFVIWDLMHFGWPEDVDPFQIVVLERGRVVEMGRYEELLGAKGRFAGLVRNQATGI